MARSISGTAPAVSAGADSVFECDASCALPGVSAPVTESPSTPVRKGAGNSDDGFLGTIPLCRSQRLLSACTSRPEANAVSRGLAALAL